MLRMLLNVNICFIVFYVFGVEVLLNLIISIC